MFNYIFLTIILIIFVIFIIFYYNINTINLSKRSGDKELFSGERSSKENTYLYKEQNKKAYYNKKEIYDNKKEYVLDDITLQNLLEDYNKIK